MNISHTFFQVNELTNWWLQPITTLVTIILALKSQPAIWSVQIFVSAYSERPITKDESVVP